MTTKEDNRPSLQFYPKDWMTDDGLKVCSLAAQGLWINLLCQMFFSPVRGALLHANGIQKSVEDITNYTYKTNTKVIQNLIKELEDNRVFDRLENGTIVNRKMYREWQLSKKRQAAVNTRWHTKGCDVVDTKAIHLAVEAVEDVSLGVAVESVSLSVEVNKKKYLEFVYLFEKQYEKLVEKLGVDKVKEMIARLDAYIGQIGEKAGKKKYDSHYHTILNWVNRDEKEGKGGINKSGGLQSAPGKYAAAGEITPETDL